MVRHVFFFLRTRHPVHAHTHACMLRNYSAADVGTQSDALTRVRKFHWSTHTGREKSDTLAEGSNGAATVGREVRSFFFPCCHCCRWWCAAAAAPVYPIILISGATRPSNLAILMGLIRSRGEEERATNIEGTTKKKTHKDAFTSASVYSVLRRGHWNAELLLVESQLGGWRIEQRNKERDRISLDAFTGICSLWLQMCNNIMLDKANEGLRLCY